MRLKLISLACFLLFFSIAFCNVSITQLVDLKSDKSAIEKIQRAKLLTPAGPFCITDLPENLVASTPGGTWSGNGITDVVNGTFDPSIAGAGDHTITYVSGAGTETMTIHVDDLADATITPAGTFCESNAPINLTAANNGGIWSGNGITVPMNGTFSPSFAGAGTHTITYTVQNGECSDTDTEDFTVDAYPDSDWTDIGPFCISDAPMNIVSVTAGGIYFGTGITDGILGTFDPTIAGIGTHQVSYSIINGVCTSTTTKDVEVTPLVDATIAPAGPICDNANTINLTAGTSGGTWSGNGIVNASTGAFDPSVAGPGTHTIDYTVTNGGCTDSDSENILVYLSPDATFPPVDNVCENDPPFDIIPANLGGTWTGTGITDAVNGTFNPSVAGVGSHMITYTLTNANCSDFQIRRVTVDPLVVATITPVGPFCEDEAELTLTSVDPGGTWSGTGITDIVNGTFNPAIAGPGVHTITYGLAIGACEDTATENIQVDMIPISTINPAGPFCITDPAINLTSVTPGGSWSGTGITDVVNGIFNPTTAGDGDHIITYTIVNGACTSQSTINIHVDLDVDATITPVAPLCESDAAFNLVGADAGGTWSGTGIIDPVNGTFDPTSAGAGIHTITYGIALGACTDTDTENIQVDMMPNSTINPVGSFCITDPAVNLTSVTPGGTWSGTGITDVVNGTFNPTTAGDGDHIITYTIVNGACTSQSSINIHVDLDVDATITPVAPLCDSDAAFNLLGTDAGGTWSGTGIIDPVNGTFDPSVATVGIHTITYTIVNGVCSDTDTEDIDVNLSPDPTIFGAGPFCADDIAINLISLNPGGIWSGNGITDPVNGTFNPTIADGGDHIITYTLTLGICISSASITIHVDDDVDATITPVGPFCQNDATIGLTAVSSGGTWAGIGITDGALGTFDPAIAGVGTFNITYDVVNGLCSDSDNISIDVLLAPDATINDPGEFCSDDGPVNLVAATPGGIWAGSGITDPINGIFDPSVAIDGGNVITYTVSNPACTSVDNITIFVYDAAVDATITSTGPYCISDGLITLNAVSPGGTWSGTGITDPVNGIFDLSSAGVGSHVITYDVGNPACFDTDSQTFQIDDTLSAIITPVAPVCENDAAFNFVAANAGGTWSGTGITNAINGTFNPGVSGPGTITITYTISQGVCTNTDNYDLIVAPTVDATINAVGPFCITSGQQNLSVVSSGGTWSGTGITDAVNGIFDPTIAGAGSHIITYNLSNVACSDTDTETIQIDDTLSAIINPVAPVCENDAAFNFVAANAGGTWSGTGITNAINGTFNPGVSGPGTITITYTISQGVCTNTDTYDLTVAPAVDATISAVVPLCITSGQINLSAVSSGGTWSGTGITDAVNGVFDPTIAGAGSQIITYNVSNVACSDTDTETIQVDDTLSAIINPLGTVCENDLPFNLSAANAGGIWNGSGITDVVNGTFDPSITGVGTVTITYTISQGVCTNVDTYDVVVSPGVDATITPAGPFCETDASVNLIAVDAGGTWSGSGITDAVNGTFDPLVANPGVHTITYTVTNGLCSDTDTELLTVYLYPDSDWFDIGPFCSNDAPVNIIPVTAGGTFTGTGITNGVLGTFDPTAASAGTHDITYTFVNGTCTSSTTKPVVVYDDVDANITTTGPFCDNDNTFLLTATESGGTWSGPGVVNPANGLFTPAVAGAGVHQIIYEINNANCSDSDTALILINISPDPDYPEIDNVCETDPPFDIIPVNFGGTWTGTGITDAVNGTFDPSVAGVGSHMITYTMSNPNCTASLIRRITVDPLVDATITPAGPFCENDSEQILISADAGGTWSGTGITNATSGAFNPAIAGPGIHPITYGLAIGACEDTATENIQVDILPNATINPAGPFCTNDPAVNINPINPGGTWSGTGITDAVLGTFDPTVSGSGDFAITYTLVNGACTVQGSTSIHVDADVDATITPVPQTCEYEPAFNLVAVDAGGTWSGNGITDVVNGTFDPTLAGPGLHTITYSITNGICSDTDTEVIDVSADPNSTIFAAGPFCSNEAAINLSSVTPGGTWSGVGITDAVLGTFDPNTATGGDHIITYTLSVGACTNSSTITIHVDADVDATITPAGPFCQFDPSANLSAVSTGGTWSGTGITDAVNGTFDPTIAGVGIYNITYDVVNGLCSDSDNTNITVLIAPDASITDPGEFCSDDFSVNLTAATPGGSWAGSGITDAVLGTFNPSVANDGANNVTYTVTSGGCTSVGTITIYVYDAAVDATITSTGPYCISDGQLTLSAVSSGGVWSGTGIVDAANGIFDLSVVGIGSHVITYDVGNPACFDTDSQTIQIDDSISAIITSVAPVCENASAFDFTAANAGGVWTGTGITNAALGTFNPVVSGDGIHIITYTTTQGVCTNIDTFDMQIDSLVDATITPAGPFCEDEAITTLAAADAGGTWSGTGIVNASTGLFHPGVAGIGDHIITYTVTNGTCTDTDTETIHIDSYPNTSISAAGPFCESDPALNLNAATGGGFWSGNGITDIVLGTFDPSIANGGSHTITYEITNGACYSSSTQVIDVDNFYDATITPVGPFCNIEASVNLTSVTTGGVWSGTGITDAVVGTFHPGASGPGDFVIQYQISNGLCSDTDNITIHVDEYFDATISPISDYCESDPAVNFVAANPGGVWSGTGIIFPATGTFDPAIATNGDYTITYEITNGACYSSDTETVHVDYQPDPTITPAGPFCENAASLTLTATDAGGTWTGTGITDSGIGAFNPAVATAGDHIITYDIVNGTCSASDTETIHVDSYPNTNLSPVGPFCETDAVVDLVEPSLGGIWSGTGIINTITGAFDPSFAGGGTHPITYTVVNGACTSSGTINIIVDNLVDATITDVGPFCETDGSITLNAVTPGGNWSGTGIVNPVTGLFNPTLADGGTHTITYYVENGVCNDTDDTDIIVEDTATVIITTTGPYCETEGNQILAANIAGGIWSGSSVDMTGNFNPGVAGVGVHPIIYTLTTGSCTVSDQVDINVDEYFDAEITSTGPYCFNDDAEYLSTVNGGGVWSGDGITVDGLFSPSAAGVGNHILTYEITNGACFDDDTQSISVNNNPDATISGPTEMCLNTPIFNYTAATSGGTWIGDGFTDIVAGTYNPALEGPGGFLIAYSITVNGCSSMGIDTITIYDLPVVTISGLDADYCINDESVLVDVSPVGGTLSGGNIAGTLFDPIVAGVGTHQISYVYTDVNSCTDSVLFSLDVHDLPAVSISGLDATYCPYSDTIYPILLPIGGTFEGAGTGDITFIASEAGPGDHDLQYYFTDVHGCSDTAYVSTTVFPYTDIEFDVTQPLCFGDANGVITTEVTGSPDPYNYLWSDIGPTVTADISGVSTGWYYLSVTDNNLCETVDSIFVDEPTELIVDIASFSDAACFGFDNAWANAIASGGTPEYDYLWNDFEMTDSSFLDSITAGTYIVITTDSNLCQATDTVIIDQPDTLSLSFIDIIDVSCYLYNDGSVTVEPAGGTGPYNAIWNDVDSTIGLNITDISAGYYTVTITDDHDCQIIDSVLISQPDSIYFESTINPVICTQQLGSAGITVYGGTSPYEYNWSGGDTIPVLFNMIAGIYDFTIEDANGCILESSIEIPADGEIAVDITQTNFNLCYKDEIAELIAFSSDGAGQLNYLWSNFVMDSINPNLPANDYYITITDSWGCSGIDSIVVTEPDQLILEMTSEDIRCKGEQTGTASVSIQGGTEPYYALWDNNDTSYFTNGLGPGEIGVTITDENGCIESTSALITEPETGIEVWMNIEQVSCFGASDGSINSFASGGNPPYFYEWYINGTEIIGATIKNLDVGFYTLHVTDNNGCTADTTVQIVEANSLIATAETGNTSCIGNYDGYIQIFAGGGTEPYSYYFMDILWESNIVDSLYKGDYYITVRDSNNCEYTFGPVSIYDTDQDCLRIPAAFSPNGDGYNDEFYIENLHLYPRAVVQIFNRWGQLLYEDLGINGFWDGTYNGNPVPTGAYLYNIILNINEDPRVGTVTIIR